LGSTSNTRFVSTFSAASGIFAAMHAWKRCECCAVRWSSVGAAIVTARSKGAMAAAGLALATATSLSSAQTRANLTGSFAA